MQFEIETKTTNRNEHKYKLPSVTVLNFILKTSCSCIFPPLPTTSLHGALGWSLWKLSCTSAERTRCQGCKKQKECAYPLLFDTIRPNEKFVLPGVGKEAPRPMVISPGAPFVPTKALKVPIKPLQKFSFRVCLIQNHRKHIEILKKAMNLIGEKGLIVLSGKHLRFRTLAVREIYYPESSLEDFFYKGNIDSCCLHFITPLRIKSGGRIVSSLNTETLLAAISRRCESLAAMYGEKWPEPFDYKKISSKIDIKNHLEVIKIKRFSSRQGKEMVWPGLIGKVELFGKALSAIFPLLRFCELVHVGKNTTFGFGRFNLL